MNQRKKWNWISAVALALQLAAEGLTLAVIWKLDMLPTLYNTILIVIFVLLGCVTGVLLFAHGKKKTVSPSRRIVALVLVLLIVCACAAVSVVVSDVYNTMDTITNTELSGPTRSVYVRVDDPAQTLSDAADYPFGIVENYDEESTRQAIVVIEGVLGKTIQVSSFSAVTQMVDALYAEEVDAIILNSAYAAILEDDESYADFSEKTRVLCQIPIEGWTAVTDPEETMQPDDLEETRTPVVEANITNTPFAIYVSGSDTRSSKLTTSRSDVNILVVVNPETKQVLLVNTPRDYYIANPAGNGAKDKLTHCGIYGVDCSMRALSDLYDVDISYYAQINFTGFETFIDAIGGVTVYSDVSFSAQGTWIQAGENYLNGEQALSFARERYNLAGGDNARGKNQMKVIKAVIEKLTSGTTIISNYAGILSSLEGMFVTDITMEEISRLVKMQLSDMASWNVQTYAVTGTGGSNVTYSMPGTKAYVMYPNESTVAHASELIDRVLAGEILTEEDIQ